VQRNVSEPSASPVWSGPSNSTKVPSRVTSIAPSSSPSAGELVAASSVPTNWVSTSSPRRTRTFAVATSPVTSVSKVVVRLSSGAVIPAA